MIIKIMFFSIISLTMKYLFFWPLTPFVVLFVNKKGELPSLFFWFTTPDNPKLEDDGWIHESRPFLKQNTRFKRYINRCFWLWRNSGYGFSESVLSVTIKDKDVLVIDGNPRVSNYPYGVSGFVKRYLLRNNNVIAVQYYYVRQWKILPKKCIRINIGWKLWGDIKPGTKVHFAFSPWFLNKFGVQK